MQVGWTKPLNVEGLSWTEPEQLGGRQLASVEQIRSSTTLLDMLRGGVQCFLQHCYRDARDEMQWLVVARAIL